MDKTVIVAVSEVSILLKAFILLVHGPDAETSMADIKRRAALSIPAATARHTA